MPHYSPKREVGTEIRNRVKEGFNTHQALFGRNLVPWDEEFNWWDFIYAIFKTLKSIAEVVIAVCAIHTGFHEIRRFLNENGYV